MSDTSIFKERIRAAQKAARRGSVKEADPLPRDASTKLAPRRGALAFCSLGLLGLITCDKPQEITYQDGTTALAWIGLQLSDRLYTIGRDTKEPRLRRARMGGEWSSRSPTVVGYIDNLDDFLRNRLNISSIA
jgi:hypothetical protein